MAKFLDTIFGGPDPHIDKYESAYDYTNIQETEPPLDENKIDRSKLNPLQARIYEEEGDAIATTKFDRLLNYAYVNVEVLNRGVDMLVDSASEINYDVKDTLSFPAVAGSGLKRKTIHNLLNYRANLYEDLSTFRRNLFMDLIMEGNAFIYWDGGFLYNLPANKIEILTDKKVKIKGYRYSGDSRIYTTNEVIHISENSADTLYRGDSRLISARTSINTLVAMLDYQQNFFKNGAVPGLVLMTDDILSPKIKDRMVAMWMQKYNPRTGGRRPVVLDGGMKLDSINAGSFKELDFTTSINDHEQRILKALGVPPVLLNSGNNANLTPNLKLFYQITVTPLVSKVVSAFERFFAYDIEYDTSKVKALRPDLRDEAAYYTSLVNNGIILGNEARIGLRLEPLDDPQMDKIRIPANVAGSATGVSGEEGGKPNNNTEED